MCGCKAVGNQGPIRQTFFIFFEYLRPSYHKTWHKPSALQEWSITYDNLVIRHAYTPSSRVLCIWWGMRHGQTQSGQSRDSFEWPKAGCSKVAEEGWERAALTTIPPGGRPSPSLNSWTEVYPRRPRWPSTRAQETQPLGRVEVAIKSDGTCCSFCCRWRGRLLERIPNESF